MAVDLYCGAEICFPLANDAVCFCSAETYGPGSWDLRRNLELARLDNVDAMGWGSTGGRPDTDADVIIVDPPRAGLAPELFKAALNQYVLYIRFM